MKIEIPTHTKDQLRTCRQIVNDLYNDVCTDYNHRHSVPSAMFKDLVEGLHHITEYVIGDDNRPGEIIPELIIVIRDDFVPTLHDLSTDMAAIWQEVYTLSLIDQNRATSYLEALLDNLIRSGKIDALKNAGTKIDELILLHSQEHIIG